ncbi:hypothetical protein, partial [Moorena sp. SIO3I6]|uniref:hypothetical protein n=1 Tax=Moorena sp. SIO3I6 TaxID=2607831 RepID=UPI0025F18681
MVWIIASLMVVDFSPPAYTYSPSLPHFSFACSVVSVVSVVNMIKINMVSVVNTPRERVEVIALVG